MKTLVFVSAFIIAISACAAPIHAGMGRTVSDSTRTYLAVQWDAAKQALYDQEDLAGDCACNKPAEPTCPGGYEKHGGQTWQNGRGYGGWGMTVPYDNSKITVFSRKCLNGSPQPCASWDVAVFCKPKQ